MTQKAQQFDLIIIGSGIAGVHTALLASKQGLRVGLVEKSKLGGSSANYSDIPFSILRQSAEQIFNLKQIENIGIRTGSISHNFPTITNNIKTAIARSQVINKSFYRNNGITLIEGNAYFLSPSKITVNKKHFISNKSLIASGADWNIPKISGISGINYLTPSSSINLDRLPKSIFIVGGHETAIFLAQTLALLGTKVYLSQTALRLLPQFDQEFSDEIENYLTEEFDITIATSSRVLQTVKHYNQVDIQFIHAGVKRQVIVDKVLLAERLLPHTDLGLNNASVEYEANGLITNEFLQTSNKNIFGAGDVLGMTHSPQVAVLEAETAFYNLTHVKKRSINYNNYPIITNTYPKLAKVGLTEDDCVKQDLDFKTITVNFKEAPHNILLQSPQSGLLKIIINPKNQIIGAAVFGPEAEGIIHQLALAVSNNFTINQVLELPSQFLSWYELINIAGNKLT